MWRRAQKWLKVEMFENVRTMRMLFVYQLYFLSHFFPFSSSLSRLRHNVNPLTVTLTLTLQLVGVSVITPICVAFKHIDRHIYIYKYMQCNHFDELFGVLSCAPKNQTCEKISITSLWECKNHKKIHLSVVIRHRKYVIPNMIYTFIHRHTLTHI